MGLAAWTAVKRRLIAIETATRRVIGGQGGIWMIASTRRLDCWDARRLYEGIYGDLFRESLATPYASQQMAVPSAVSY